MKRFRDIRIKQKLMLLIIVITAAALLVSGVGIVIADSILFHGYLERDLSTFARVIADNSSASLAFDDPQSAAEILGALRARTHIVVACLFRGDGSTLAKYARAGADTPCPDAAGRDSVASTFRSITVVQSVNLQGRRLGTLVLFYDLGEIPERIRIYGFAVLIVLVISTLISVLLSSKLRNVFVNPILELAKTTALVSQTRDYSERAKKLSNDEVGDLVSTFNDMLAGIQSRDVDLLKSLAGREDALLRLAELNRELHRSNEELARSNADLERFAFVASHDMQEPLRMVSLYSQLLVRQYGAIDGDAVTYRDYIVSGTTRMRDLLTDLLTYIQISAAPEQVASVDLNKVIDTVTENLRMSIEESGATVEVAPLPTVQVHEGHMVSLFQNLIGNSIKYRSQQAPRIDIDAREMDGLYQFTVRDNGIGIQPQYHNKIFMPFKRLHGKDIPGTGIGLAICQRVVERYGGRIWIESEAGLGAAFIFTIPKPPEDVNSL
jgi:signal transduction histidine kinase